MTRNRPTDTATFAAAFVLGLEGSLTDDEREVAVQRLARSVRPWDRVVDVDAETVGVLCATITNAREIDAIAARLADVVRAPMAVGDDVRTIGVCVGSAPVADGEDPQAAMDLAGAKMRQMRAARAGLLAPEVPRPRNNTVVLPR